tara:strand:- start:4906 stop:5937 length:1032 start_codon:yes stop_codon:yes gene_type:complete
MKVLVTGGSGYFGSLLIKKLLEKGYQVGSLDINPAENISKEVTFHKVDIRNYDLLKNSLSGYDIIYHNVAQVPLAKSKKLFKEVNIYGVENICKASIFNKVKKIVYTSSSAIYGVPKQNPVNEDTIPIPGESYGEAKLVGEEIVKKYSKNGLGISIIRPRTILGHGRLGIFSILFKWISEGVNIPVLNNGENIYQFVHAEDLADACILASMRDHQFSAFNIGASDQGTMRNTLENLCQYAGSGSSVYSLPLKPVEIIMNLTSKLNLIPLGPYHSLMYGRSLYFDISKAKKELGFSPKFSTSRMFQESYDWFLENRHLINSQNNNSVHKKPVNEALLKLLRWIS